MTSPSPDEDAAESADLTEIEDGPVRSLEDDRLGRRPFIDALVAEILSVPIDRGFVVGLTGPWGSGKTSILNMAVDAIGEQALVVQFNPWMFSGTEELVSSFFAEIAKQLEKKRSSLRELARRLSTYGRLLSPLATVVGASAALSGASEVLERLAQNPSVFEEHEELRILLGELDRRLIVIVDDLDRLSPREVHDVVRLVRLVADFPNTTYVLAFDRGRVEECLGEGDASRGRAYLDKIVQVTVNVPATSQPDVAAMFIQGLGQLGDTHTTGPFKSDDWQNVFTFVVGPLLKTPRGVKRLLSALSLTMRLVGDEIAIADLVGIEAIRVLRPEMFEAITSVTPYLSASRSASAYGGHLAGVNAIDSPIGPLFKVDAAFAPVVCRWLFPGASHFFENMHHGSEWNVRWRQERKVASSEVLRFYLEGKLPNGVVPASVVSAALEHLGDREPLQAILVSLSPIEMLDLIERMNPAIEEMDLNESQSARAASIALPALMNLLPILPEDTGMWGQTGSMTLMRAALRLLKRLPTEDARAECLRSVLPDIQSYSAQLTVLMVAGHREGVGNALIASDVATELEESLRVKLTALSAEEFALETRSVRLADFLSETPEGRTSIRAKAANDSVMLALLVGSVGMARSQVIGAAAVGSTAVLSWDLLVNYLGEDVLVRRISELITAVAADELVVSKEQLDALTLAGAYAVGDRPQNPMERFIRNQPSDNDPSGTSVTEDDPQILEGEDD